MQEVAVGIDYIDVISNVENFDPCTESSSTACGRCSGKRSRHVGKAAGNCASRRAIVQTGAGKSMT